MSLREKVICPLPKSPSTRFLPVVHVMELRKHLNTLAVSPSSDINNKTVESRIRPILAARNVYIYSLSRKFRCYALSGALSNTVNSIVSLSGAEEVNVLPKERRRLLQEVGLRFWMQRGNYRAGKWPLSEEILSIPPRLWTTTILDMASNRHLAA